MKWTRTHKSIFSSRLLNVTEWLKKADDLIDTASLLETKVIQVWDDLKSEHLGKEVTPKHKRTGYFGTYFMLMAFAIENILKAKIISKKRLEFRKFIDQEEKLPTEIKSHDLYKLANILNISLEAGEEGLLRRLSRSAVWAGRYPVPLKYQDLIAQRYSNGSERGTSAFFKSDIQRVKELLNKLRNA